MPELCFATNLTSSEWAAWVQAIGSIGAIVAAIWIMGRQHRADRKRQLDARHARVQATHEIIRVVTASVHAAVNAVSKFDCDEPSEDVKGLSQNAILAAVRNAVSNLTAADRILDVVPPQMLDEPMLSGIVARMRRSIELALGVINDARQTNGFLPYDIANIASKATSNAAGSATEFEDFLRDVSANPKKLGKGG